MTQDENIQTQLISAIGILANISVVLKGGKDPVKGCLVVSQDLLNFAEGKTWLVLEKIQDIQGSLDRRGLVFLFHPSAKREKGTISLRFNI